MTVTATTHELDNGLRIIAVEMPHIHTATVAVFVRAGSRFETRADNGLSHFVEHMLFRGTAAHVSSHKLAFAIESLGGTLDAETGRDMSLFHISLEPGLVDAGIELLAEVVGRPRLDEIEMERSLILEELREDYDEYGDETHGEDVVRGLLFGDHPLGQRIIGTMSNVKRFDDGDVKRHYERCYCARNMLLCVAGPIQPAAVFESAARHMSFLPEGQLIELVPVSFHQREVRYHYSARSGSQTNIDLIFRALPDMPAGMAFGGLEDIGLENGYMTSVAFLRAIDDGMSTPLHYELCDRRGLAYSVGAAIEPLADTALLELTGTAGQGKIADLLRGMLDVLARFRDELITDAELLRIRRRYRNDHLASLDDSHAMAAFHGGTSLFYAPPSLETRRAEMDAITAEDIRTVARHIVQPDRLAIAVIGPLTRARQGEVRELVQGWR